LRAQKQLFNSNSLEQQTKTGKEKPASLRHAAMHNAAAAACDAAVREAKGQLAHQQELTGACLIKHRSYMQFTFTNSMLECIASQVGVLCHMPRVQVGMWWPNQSCIFCAGRKEAAAATAIQVMIFLSL
jgi:hypothetical protein